MLEHRKTTKWKLGAVLLAAGLLAACSSSSKSSSGTTNSTASTGGTTASSTGSSTGGTTATSAAQATGTPLKIGMICGCTGPLASSVFAAHPAVEAWASYVNDHGGINGHPVQIIFEDDKSMPAVSVAAAHTLIADHVLAIFDISNFDTQWGSYVAQNKVPIIPTNSTTIGTLSSADFFTPGETIDALPPSVVQAAAKVGAKKFALLYCAESPDCTQLVTPIKQSASASGLQLAYTAQISFAAPNYTAACLGAKQAGAQAVFVGDAVSVLIHVAGDCNRQGFKPVFIGDDGAVSPSFASSPGWSNGMLAAQPNVPFDVKNTAATEAMYGAFAKYQPGFTSNPSFNELAVEGWAAGKLFEAAAKAGQLGVNGPPTTTELYNGFYSASLQGTTLDGLAPPLHFTQGKPNVNDCWFWQRTTNGQFTEPYGLTPVCSSKS